MLLRTGDLDRQQTLSRQSRPCPPDFEIIFIEQGRLECEAHYRARRTTITRWLEESGKAKLIGKRAEFVRYQRQSAKAKPKPKAKADADQPVDRRKVNARLIELASAFLQDIKHGGWAIYAKPNGRFVVGTTCKSGAEVIAMAERKGFNKRRAIEQIRAFAEPN